MHNRKLRSFILTAIIVLTPMKWAHGADAPVSPAAAPSTPSPAEPFKKKKAPIDLSADFLSYDETTDTYFARGSVAVVQAGTTLKADTVVADMSAGIATASGHVEVVDEGGNVISGDSLVFNIKTENAVLAKGRIFFQKQGIIITGDAIRKTGLQTYEAENISFTTCECKEGESPAWSFGAASAKVTLGQYLTGSNARFYIKGVPILYTPYISLPVRRERQTGFLSPQLGYSQLRGFVFDEAFYWAISGNTDATFYLDEETSRGTGGAVEYRYIRTRKSYGEAYFNYFREKDIDRVRAFRSSLNLTRPLNANDDRWQFRLTHTEDFGNGLVFKANINQVSDNEYLVDFGKDPAERALESTESNISLSKSWSSYSLVAQARYFTNLMESGNAATLQELPRVTFTGAGQKIPYTPLYFSMESSVVNFYRKTGIDGGRLDVHPRISLPLSAAGYLDFTPSIAPRETLYVVRNDPDGTFFNRLLYDVTVDMTTSFYRVFNTGLDSVGALRHSIRPRITYVYIPGVSGTFPIFDAIDSIPATNTITYSLNNIITGKYLSGGVEKYWDYIYLDLSQSYDFNEATRALTSPGDRRKPFSDVTGELTAKPTELSTLLAKSTYDLYTGSFTSVSAQLTAADKRGDNLNLLYSFLKNTPGMVTTALITGPSIVTGQTGLIGTLGVAGSTRYFEGSTKIHIIEPLDFLYVKRYSFDTHSSLDTSYAIQYTLQCWGVVLSYTRRPEEKLVFLTVSLKGIGKIGGLHGSF
jgi:LPS-assembly protein